MIEMNENLRELITFREVNLEEREKFEKRYREEQRVLKKLRSKKRFRRRQCEKVGLKNLKDMVKKMTDNLEKTTFKTIEKK
jgi:hypothetical protein